MSGGFRIAGSTAVVEAKFETVGPAVFIGKEFKTVKARTNLFDLWQD